MELVNASWKKIIINLITKLPKSKDPIKKILYNSIIIIINKLVDLFISYHLKKLSMWSSLNNFLLIELYNIKTHYNTSSMIKKILYIHILDNISKKI